jgi:trans-aconitate 2-methyltransferase
MVLDPGAWDAEAYDELSNPQYAWGQHVLDRLELRGDETVLDAGCGTGRLTAQLLDRVPDGRVLAVDRSETMLTEARSNLALHGNRILYVCTDLLALGLTGPVDAVFSTATFHWILDHARLFRSIAGVLAPGGALEAQCGGGPNLARLRARVQQLLAAEPYAGHLAGWREPWLFSSPGVAAQLLERAGFVDVVTSLEPAPTRFESAEMYRRFLEQIVLWPYLARLPSSLHRPFIGSLVAQAAVDDPPFILDYWRLNLRGRRPS